MTKAMGVSKSLKAAGGRVQDRGRCRRRQSKIRILQTSAKAFRLRFPESRKSSCLDCRCASTAGRSVQQPLIRKEVKFNGERLCEFQKGKAKWELIWSQKAAELELREQPLCFCVFRGEATERRSQLLSSSHEAAQTLAEDSQQRLLVHCRFPIPGRILRRCLRSTSFIRARWAALQAARWCRGT